MTQFLPRIPGVPGPPQAPGESDEDRAESRPVFVDGSGRRRRWLRRGAAALSALCVGYLGVLGAAVGGGVIDPGSPLPLLDIVGPLVSGDSTGGTSGGTATDQGGGDRDAGPEAADGAIPVADPSLTADPVPGAVPPAAPVGGTGAATTTPGGPGTTTTPGTPGGETPPGDGTETGTPPVDPPPTGGEDPPPTTDPSPPADPDPTVDPTVDPSANPTATGTATGTGPDATTI